MVERRQLEEVRDLVVQLALGRVLAEEPAKPASDRTQRHTLCLEKSRDRGSASPPVARVRLELGGALPGQRVVLAAPAVFGGPPFRIEEPAALEALKREHERPRVDAEHALADLLDALSDTKAVH